MSFNILISILTTCLSLNVAQTIVIYKHSVAGLFEEFEDQFSNQVFTRCLFTCVHIVGPILVYHVLNKM